MSIRDVSGVGPEWGKADHGVVLSGIGCEGDTGCDRGARRMGVSLTTIGEQHTIFVRFCQW